MNEDMLKFLKVGTLIRYGENTGIIIEVVYKTRCRIEWLTGGYVGLNNFPWALGKQKLTILSE